MPRSVVTGRSIPGDRGRQGHASASGIRTAASRRTCKAGATEGCSKPHRASARRSPRNGKPRRAQEARATRRARPSRSKAAKSGLGARCRTSCRRRSRRCATVAPGGSGWVHEIKFDGYRIQARLDHGEVRLLTRKGLDWTDEVSQCRRRGRRAAGRDRADRRRDRGRGRARRAELLGPAGRAQGRAARALRLLRLRSAPPRRPRSAAAAADRAQGRAGANSSAATASGPIRFSEHFEDDGARDAASTPARWGSKASCRSARRALSQRPLGGFRQDQVLERAGAGGRRLCAVERDAEGDRRAGGRLLRRRQAASMPAASAPATRRRSRGTCGSGCIRSKSPSRRSTTFRAPSAARRAGSSRRW